MPKNSVRKNRSIIIACVMLFVVILTGSILLFSRTQEEGMYFLTFESRRADKYVEEHIGEFLDSESGINPIDRDTVKVGAGIYVEDFDETTSLPMFYYPVFTDESLSYVFRIYEDINGEYTSVGYRRCRCNDSICFGHAKECRFLRSKSRKSDCDLFEFRL